MRVGRLRPASASPTSHKPYAAQSHLHHVTVRRVRDSKHVRPQALRRLDPLLPHVPHVIVLGEQLLPVQGQPLERVYGKQDGVRRERVYLPSVETPAQRVQDRSLVQVRQRDEVFDVVHVLLIGELEIIQLVACKSKIRIFKGNKNARLTYQNATHPNEP